MRTILCPVDFSEQSRGALLWASAIAQHRGAELTVLSVLEPLLAQAAAIRLGIDLVRTADEPALREFVETTLREDVRQRAHVRMKVTVGAPAEGILATSRRLNPALIVMGTHGLGGFRKLLLGSTTEQVLRRTEWPVLAVPAGPVTASAVEHPGIQLKSILLATDFRDSATAATRWAVDLAADIGIPLVLADVVDSADKIAAIGIENRAGLVVMALANPEDSDSCIPGSIAYRVLRSAHLPVVVVPAVINADPAAVTERRLTRSVGATASTTMAASTQSGPSRDSGEQL